MSIRSRISRLCWTLAAATCLSPAFHATPLAARESVAFRASPLPQPAPLLQMAHATLKAAPQPTFDRALFGTLEASPLVDLAPIVATPRDDRSFTLELLDARQRALALALDDWSRAAPRGIEQRRLRAAIVGFYVARDFMPLWLDGADWRLSARAAARRLREAGEDGLDISAYKIPAMEAGASRSLDEIALSEAVAAYVAQASGSRVDPRRISRLIGARPAAPDMGEALARVAMAGDGGDEVLQDFNPAHYGYRQLRAKLIELRSRRALGDVDLLAEANNASPVTDTPSTANNAARRKMATNGTSVSRVEAEIIANMERWRWLPRDLGGSHVEVNIPEFELAVVRDGAVTHRARVIVGKEGTPTPVFSNALQFIIVNPSWNVPQSIINKEMLPKHGGDLSYLARRGWKVAYRNGKLTVRQPPGEDNALGRIKFMFPNDFSVYLHDTPSRNLFAADHRAFSHGCMRVEDPFALAEAVLGPGSGWSEERVKRLIGGSERYINLSKPLPIHIEYFTAFVDEDGRLQMRGDLYGYSALVRSALGLGG
jgi:L,D-transpeptidase YcbB